MTAAEAPVAIRVSMFGAPLISERKPTMKNFLFAKRTGIVSMNWVNA